MSHSEPARIAPGSIRFAVLIALVAAVTTLVGVVTARSIGPSLARRVSSVFSNTRPAVANLDLKLLGALRQATARAAKDGVGIAVNSGWRSPQYQKQLLHAAISKYGSKEKAARWVATADTSARVSGNAVDIRPSNAMVWLSRHGAAYGLCQIYRNEPWHYELRPDAIQHGCPPMYADPRHDPRMQP
jgi:D-alanyl-D-alanine carboxypeptidase